jgi:hypothetical protein
MKAASQASVISFQVPPQDSHGQVIQRERALYAVICIFLLDIGESGAFVMRLEDASK